MDAEVRIGCASMKWAFLMDTEVRVGCSASPALAPVLAGAAVDDARIGFFEGGAKKNDIGDLISIIRRSNAQSQLKASTIS